MVAQLDRGGGVPRLFLVQTNRGLRVCYDLWVAGQFDELPKTLYGLTVMVRPT